MFQSINEILSQIFKLSRKHKSNYYTNGGDEGIRTPVQYSLIK